MKRIYSSLIAAGFVLFAPLFAGAQTNATVIPETKEARAARMAWFDEARFGLFIHWGLYAVPAGEWDGKTNYGEWFMEETHMPVSQYEKFADQFNPVKFDAREWVRLAKDAGMKYIVITSKHHDGFGLWPSKVSDWNISRTPFSRDPLKELAAACQEAGIKLCFYHSIMDWHHPDWGQRRAWNDIATGEPDMDRYAEYMKDQLKELLTGYGPIGILWFDGEWEKPWTHERGVDLYNYVRGLQPNIIINNRAGKGRSGMAGMDKGQGVGDYGTPEQQIPAGGFGPGVAWESCMTINDHWGYNKNDQNWKSTETLIRNLVDCASKGGNYLLNVGPTAEGLIPGPSIARLGELAQWMKANAESIHGTTASPFEKLDFGRCTQKPIASGQNRLYLHVFDRPADGKLVLPGLANKPIKAFLLAGGQTLDVTAADNKVVVSLPPELPDKSDTVVALDIQGAPQIVPLIIGSTETPAQRDARMKWWREARFGMFIHWGVYAVPAGFYQGKPVKGIGEWIMNRGKIPMAEYQKFAQEFNPVKYNADAWVRAAKDAGMKYIVITSKHHDGFTLFDTKANDWSIAKASPYGKDLLQPLADACRKHGLKLGFYYSQAQDWNNGGSAAGGKWDPAQERSMDDYIDKTAVPQVREILTKYGNDIPAVVWWDTPTGMNADRATKLYKVVQELRPDLIMNNRLGGGYKGDTETPEQHIPAKGFPGRDWETCMTMNDTWGFKSDDHNWKSTEKLIFNLCDIASKGGNYLLNVGPTAVGEIPGPSLERLAEVGKWMKVNHEAIYGTSATAFGYELGKPVKGKTGYGKDAEVSSGNDWRCTTKPGKIYLHVFKWPATGTLELLGLQSKVNAAYLLAGRKKLKFAPTETGVTLTLPAQAPDKIASVICLEIADAVAKVAAPK